MATQEYSSEQIERWRSQLDNLAKQPRTVFSKKQAVEALIEPIESALSVHSYEEVARQLKNWGLEITAGSLKQYVTRYRREQMPSSKTKRKRSTSEVKEVQREPSSQAREQQGESHQQGDVNAIRSKNDEEEMRSTQAVTQKELHFEVLAQQSDTEEQETTTTWTEPTFNRNRVRPGRISS